MMNGGPQRLLLNCTSAGLVITFVMSATRGDQEFKDKMDRALVRCAALCCAALCYAALRCDVLRMCAMPSVPCCSPL